MPRIAKSDEIEITPEMIETTMRWFRGRDEFDHYLDWDLEEIIIEVYTAMVRCRPSTDEWT